MKFSFSTNKWTNTEWEEIFELAKDLKFNGIDIYMDENLFEKSKPFHKYNAKNTIRDMEDSAIKISCMDLQCDLSMTDKAVDGINSAHELKIPYIAVEYSGNSGEEAVEYLKSIVELAEQNNVTILIKTTGIFADTSKLRDVLNTFASDSLAALWDVENRENPEVTIENLGAYIRHVYIKDYKIEDDKIKYCLVGEGDAPLDEIIFALRSINYDNYISLDWNPEWIEEFGDIEIILSHFISYISKYKSASKNKNYLYSNNQKTGKYIWKKDNLIDCTFSQVLDRVVDEFPDQYAFKYTTLDYTRTYSQFRDDVDKFARSLISLGVKPGHHVSVWATNIPQWYIAFWAVTKIGAVLVSVNTAYKIHEAEYLFKQSDTHTLIMVNGYRDSNYSEIIRELCPELQNTKEGEHLHSKRLPFLRNIITVGFKQQGCITWEEAMQRADEVPIEEVRRCADNVDKNDVCNMQYTSGTTGFPKGVMLTHYNVVNNGKCIGDRMDLSTADRMMIQVPMFHCFGMVLAMTAAMTHGATLCPLPYFSPKPSLACINQEKITCFHGVPTMFIAMLEHEDFAKTDFSYMRTGIMAGSPCPISVMRDVVDKMNMKEITIVFGQTESSPGCTMSSTDDPLEVRVSTVGRALPGIECKIVNPETGEDMPDNETGEFVARGYNIMKGYYKMPKATKSAIDKDGWLHTGDLACRTPEGNYRITGRLKDMIIRGGENIYPKEIEEFIYTHDKVKDVQVIGVPDKQYGEEVMACIILKDGESITVDEMKDYIRSHMARHKVPRYIDFVDEFPMNVAGKILKYKMREHAIEKFNLKAE